MFRVRYVHSKTREVAVHRSFVIEIQFDVQASFHRKTIAPRDALRGCILFRAITINSLSL